MKIVAYNVWLLQWPMTRLPTLSGCPFSIGSPVGVCRLTEVRPLHLRPRRARTRSGVCVIRVEQPSVGRCVQTISRRVDRNVEYRQIALIVRAPKRPHRADQAPRSDCTVVERSDHTAPELIDASWSWRRVWPLWRVPCDEAPSGSSVDDRGIVWVEYDPIHALCFLVTGQAGPRGAAVGGLPDASVRSDVGGIEIRWVDSDLSHVASVYD